MVDSPVPVFSSVVVTVVTEVDSETLLDSPVPVFSSVVTVVSKVVSSVTVIKALKKCLKI